MVATPIGNLKDITLRAIEILKDVSLVACEDTRRTLQLLNHLEIKKPLISCRSQNEKAVSAKIIEELAEGNNVAYVSDAGSPGLSDPGSVLVRCVREANYPVLPIPGCSAFSCLLSVAGGLDKTVVFEGFLSPKPGRRRSRLRQLMDTEDGFILYESPFRVLKLLADVVDIDANRYLCIGREMTKMYEEYLSGSAEELRLNLASRDNIRGEFAVYVSGKKSAKLLA